MAERITKVLDVNGEYSESPDFPIAVVREATDSGNIGESKVVDPIFDHHVTRNLYGRVMTLVEATCETHKLKAVKDLFSKELISWENDVYRSARQISDGREFTDPSNIYTK